MRGSITTSPTGHRAGWVLAALALMLAACGGSAPPDNSTQSAKGTLRVSAAASMTGVLEKLFEGFGKAELKANYGPSSDLARTLKTGYPADVYISASKKWADFMEEEGLITGRHVVFAGGVLVCVAPEESDITAKNLAELADAKLERNKIAVGNDGVPAGDYAREAFKATGVIDALKPRLVGMLDVRAVLTAVRDGEVDCGFVYATDAKGSNVRTLFEVGPQNHAPIEYYICLVKHGEQPELAQEFIDFLRGDKGRAILREAGFIIPGDAD
jgi:molybdate transport system substrate-binding protein